VNEIAICDWNAFEDESEHLLERMRARHASLERFSPVLFRGQADARWELTTTLERYSSLSYPLGEYYKILMAIAPAVSSLTAKSWPLVPEATVDEAAIGPPPGYEFMIHVRHHGFPSPLLDWSRSPYVAAFFAFCDSRESTDGLSAAVYAFVERLGIVKSYGPDARIIGLGPYAVTHERHYAQQCEYTICKMPVDRSGTERWVYCSHQKALERGGEYQDVIRKFVIPWSQRDAFLAKLDQMNINAYSLYRDEASLMRMLAFREIGSLAGAARPSDQQKGRRD